MVIVRRDKTDVALFHPGESLLSQVAAWLADHGQFSLRVVSSVGPAAIDRALTQAAAVLIDATDRPGQAADALGHVLARIGPQAVAVYTERPHEGLELFVRVRGAMFLLGPMGRREWEAVFERAEGPADAPVRRELAPSPQRRPLPAARQIPGRRCARG